MRNYFYIPNIDSSLDEAYVEQVLVDAGAEDVRVMHRDWTHEEAITVGVTTYSDIDIRSHLRAHRIIS